jgi:hypothetical protein
MGAGVGNFLESSIPDTVLGVARGLGVKFGKGDQVNDELARKFIADRSKLRTRQDLQFKVQRRESERSPFEERTVTQAGTQVGGGGRGGPRVIDKLTEEELRSSRTGALKSIQEQELEAAFKKALEERAEKERKQDEEDQFKRENPLLERRGISVSDLEKFGASGGKLAGQGLLSKPKTTETKSRAEEVESRTILGRKFDVAKVNDKELIKGEGVQDFIRTLNTQFKSRRERVLRRKSRPTQSLLRGL